MPTFTPPVYLIRHYLALAGWSQEPTKIADLDVFVLHEHEGTISIPMPRNSAVPDAARRVTFALRTLSDLEERPVEAVIAAVLGQRYDLIEASVPSNMLHRETVSLDFAEALLSRGRSLMMNTAAADEQTVPVAARLRHARTYVNACRLGHTFRSSFGFRIMSPVAPIETHTALVVNPRRVVTRLSRGISAVQRAFARSDASTLLEPAAGLGASGFSDLAGILESADSDEITFNIVLSPSVPEEPYAPIVLRTASAIMLREAISNLRERPAHGDAEITGQVVRLASPFVPGDLFHPEGREIDILGETLDFGAIKVRVRLTPADYSEAIRAHEQGREVTAIGVLAPRGRKGFGMDNPTAFQVGEEL